mmetsp:Transcript_124252/g.193932  ORF Transcript_124252/g.193932 Transcript_124252/m.193932 type:complete len:220 (-) Transcript_124252:137-796(-)
MLVRILMFLVVNSLQLFGRHGPHIACGMRIGVKINAAQSEQQNTSKTAQEEQSMFKALQDIELRPSHLLHSMTLISYFQAWSFQVIVLIVGAMVATILVTRSGCQQKDIDDGNPEKIEKTLAGKSSNGCSNGEDKYYVRTPPHEMQDSDDSDSSDGEKKNRPSRSCPAARDARSSMRNRKKASTPAAPLSYHWEPVFSDGESDESDDDEVASVMSSMSS